MTRSKILLVFGKELRVMLRDRRLIVSVVFLSLLVLPFLMGFIGNMDRLTGGAEDIPVLVQFPDPLLLDVLSSQPGLRVYREASAVADSGQPYLLVYKDKDVYSIHGDFSSARLRGAGIDLKHALEAVRDSLLGASLRQLALEELVPYRVEVSDTADSTGRSGVLLGTLVPYLAILLLVANANRAMYVAVGEKEKNTLASLLISNVPRHAIVLGKILAIMLFSVGSSLLLVVGMILFANFGFSLERLPEDASYSLSAAQVGSLFFTLVPLALLISALIMLLGTFARSAREANIYTTPLLFLAILLAVFSFSNTQFGLTAYAVPILGNALAMRDTFLQTLTGPALAVSALSNGLLFGLLVWACVRMYDKESILFRE
jgi:sodium transport system permease protein